MNQDFVARIGQGAVADRTLEHPGDRGVILLRRRMLEEARKVAARGEPKAVIRNPAVNHRLALPRITRREAVAPVGEPRAPASADGPRPMVFHAGQPRATVEAMERIWAERRVRPRA